MRIGHFYRTLGRPSDGASIAALKLATAQVESGCDVRLFAWKTASLRSGTVSLEQATMPITYLHFGTWRTFRDLLTSVDILHIHAGYFSIETYVVAGLAKAFGIPYIYSPHGALGFLRVKTEPWKQRVWGRVLGTKLLNHASYVHLFSDSETELYRRYGVMSPIVVVPNGIDKQWLDRTDSDTVVDRFGANEGPFRIGFLGRLDVWTKGIDLLLEALSLFGKNSRRSFHCSIVGPDWGGGQEEIRHLAAHLGIDSAVSLRGEIERENVPTFLRTIDVLVLPSRFEGFPLALLEACACGCPVIVSHGTNGAQLVTEKGVGLVADSAAEIAAALFRMVDDPNLRLQMGQNGKRLARELTWDHVAAQMCILYSQVIGQRI